MTFEQFLVERDKIINFDLPKPGEKRGGTQQTVGKQMARGGMTKNSAPRPSTFTGLQIPHERGPMKSWRLKTLLPDGAG